ncbi:MAG: TRZ/ATZ family protein, partial [Clostridiales bacterium]|nr:TRZ/ATZ family protein [Clostridiales bacterium]
MKKLLSLPADKYQLLELKAGDMIELSGTILTGRDAAHKRMMEFLDKGETLPFDIVNQGIYYT